MLIVTVTHSLLNHVAWPAIAEQIYPHNASIHLKCALSSISNLAEGACECTLGSLYLKSEIIQWMNESNDSNEFICCIHNVQWNAWYYASVTTVVLGLHKLRVRETRLHCRRILCKQMCICKKKNLYIKYVIQNVESLKYRSKSRISLNWSSHARQCPQLISALLEWHTNCRTGEKW